MPPPVLLAVLAEIAGVKALEATEFRVHFNFLPSSGGAYAIFSFWGERGRGGNIKIAYPTSWHPNAGPSE